MTRSVVGDLRFVERRAFFQSRHLQLLADVSNTRAEFMRPASKLFVIRQEVCVGNEHRAATTCICNYRRTAFIVECFDILARKFARAFEVACMSMKRTATNLPSWCADG